MGGCPGTSRKIDATLADLICWVSFCVVLGSFKISTGRTPSANAAASEAGRLAAREEMIFFRNL
jgi:hypothetical protein